MTRKPTIDERAELYALDVRAKCAGHQYYFLEIDLELAWLAGYRAAKADERAKAKKGKP